ncbi:MAG: four helix bundle protein [Leptolyngbyaceae cyanobacterium bins.302]|nr:four helix bundle protein [Leptolyngbyaceae cyanobacterium bins.302]
MTMNQQFIISYRELRVYQTALDIAMQVFEMSQELPPEERDHLMIPLIRATRLVCVYIAQAWLKRRYQAGFIAKLNQAEVEAATAQVWLEFAVLCSYLDAQKGQELHHDYQQVLVDLSRLIDHSAAWVLPISLNS